MRRRRGFTLIEVLVVITIIATIAGLVTLLIPRARNKTNEVVCQQHVKELVGLLESAGTSRYPNHSGPNLILWLVARGQIAGRDTLGNLFCPGDQQESLADVGVAAYDQLDLNRQGEYGALTSYAARNQRDRNDRARKGSIPPVVLVADDSEDHHNNQGIVVGLTGGIARWRDKLDDYELNRDEPLIIGEGSSIPELACLRRE